jgi:hypothetical protein
MEDGTPCLSLDSIKELLTIYGPLTAAEALRELEVLEMELATGIGWDGNPIEDIP